MRYMVAVLAFFFSLSLLGQTVSPPAKPQPTIADLQKEIADLQANVKDLRNALAFLGEQHAAVTLSTSKDIEQLKNRVQKSDENLVKVMDLAGRRIDVLNKAVFGDSK